MVGRKLNLESEHLLQILLCHLLPVTLDTLPLLALISLPESWENTSTYMMGLLWGFNKMKHVKTNSLVPEMQ